MLFVIDGGKALRKAIRTVFGEVPVQRCERHYADLLVMPAGIRIRLQIAGSAAVVSA